MNGLFGYELLLLSYLKGIRYWHSLLKIVAWMSFFRGLLKPPRQKIRKLAKIRKNTSFPKKLYFSETFILRAVNLFEKKL